VSGSNAVFGKLMLLLFFGGIIHSLIDFTVAYVIGVKIKNHFTMEVFSPEKFIQPKKFMRKTTVEE
jgi:hypothetical protein